LNKNVPPGYFDGNDIYAIDLLGSVAAEVLTVSEAMRSNLANDRRKNILLKVAVSMMRRNNEFVNILAEFQETLQILFEAHSIQIRLAYGDYTKQIVVKAGRIVLVDTPGVSRAAGLVGESIRQRVQMATPSYNWKTDQQVNPSIDLALPLDASTKDYMLHSIPVFDKATLSFVIQFWCVIKDRQGIGGDDGTYTPSNRVHRLIMDKFTQFFRARLDEVYPVQERLRSHKNWDQGVRKKARNMLAFNQHKHHEHVPDLPLPEEKPKPVRVIPPVETIQEETSALFAEEDGLADNEEPDEEEQVADPMLTKVRESSQIRSSMCNLGDKGESSQSEDEDEITSIFPDAETTRRTLSNEDGRVVIRMASCRSVPVGSTVDVRRNTENTTPREKGSGTDRDRSVWFGEPTALEDGDDENEGKKTDLAREVDPRESISFDVIQEEKAKRKTEVRPDERLADGFIEENERGEIEKSAEVSLVIEGKERRKTEVMPDERIADGFIEEKERGEIEKSAEVSLVIEGKERRKTEVMPDERIADGFIEEKERGEIEKSAEVSLVIEGKESLNMEKSAEGEFPVIKEKIEELPTLLDESFAVESVAVKSDDCVPAE